MRKTEAQTAADQSSSGGIHGAPKPGSVWRRRPARPKIATFPSFIIMHRCAALEKLIRKHVVRVIDRRAPMASKILLPLLLLAAASPAALAGFNLLEMLANKPAYKQFSKLLAQSKVAEEANRLRVATLLVVTDKTIQPLAALPADKQRLALASHVLLSYVDPIKLDEMKTRTAALPTMLSATNKALGFLNYTEADDGQMYFGMPGAPVVAKLIKVVAARPYSISIMEISEPILPPGSGTGPAGGRRAKAGKGLSSETEAVAPAGAAR